MKIITLWQPYATLIAMGLKDYETRHWVTNYRGPLLIHAAKRKMSYDEKQTWDNAIAIARKVGCFLPPNQVPFPEQLPYGAVVAIAELKDCQMMQCRNGTGEIDSHYPSELEQAVGFWQDGRYAWELGDVERLVEPIPAKGMQGLFNAPPALKEAIAAAQKQSILVPF
jgi:activating signal cointegrator 1